MVTFLAVSRNRDLLFVFKAKKASHIGILISYTGTGRTSSQVFEHFIFFQHVLEMEEREKWIIVRDEGNT